MEVFMSSVIMKKGAMTLLFMKWMSTIIMVGQRKSVSGDSKVQNLFLVVVPMAVLMTGY